MTPSVHSAFQNFNLFGIGKLDRSDLKGLVRKSDQDFCDDTYLLRYEIEII